MTEAPAWQRVFDRVWFCAAPAERLAALRIFVGLFACAYALGRFPYLVTYAGFNPSAFSPIGIVAILDRPLVPAAVYAIAALTAALSIPFVLGWRMRIVGPAFALVLLWTLTYRNSWGMIFHTENLLVIHVLLLGVTRSADAWSLDARRTGASFEPHGRYGWPIKAMGWVLVGTYVLAGIAKLRYGGPEWTDGDVLRNYVATDNLRKVLLGSSHSPLAGLFLTRSWLLSALAYVTLIVELGAPIAMLGGRTAALWVATAMGFHWGVFALMVIVFPYPMFGVGFLCLFRAEALARWLVRRGRSIRNRLKRSRDK
jgi:hypothetical protein